MRVGCLIGARGAAAARPADPPRILLRRRVPDPGRPAESRSRAPLRQGDQRRSARGQADADDDSRLAARQRRRAPRADARSSARRAIGALARGVAWVRALMERTGALEHARTVARALAGAALFEFDQYFARRPGQPRPPLHAQPADLGAAALSLTGIGRPRDERHDPALRRNRLHRTADRRRRRTRVGESDAGRLSDDSRWTRRPRAVEQARRASTAWSYRVFGLDDRRRRSSAS